MIKKVGNVIVFLIVTASNLLANPVRCFILESEIEKTPIEIYEGKISEKLRSASK